MEAGLQKILPSTWQRNWWKIFFVSFLKILENCNYPPILGRESLRVSSFRPYINALNGWILWMTEWMVGPNTFDTYRSRRPKLLKLSNYRKFRLQNRFPGCAESTSEHLNAKFEVWNQYTIIKFEVSNFQTFQKIQTLNEPLFSLESLVFTKSYIYQYNRGIFSLETYIAPP